MRGWEGTEWSPDVNRDKSPSCIVLKNWGTACLQPIFYAHTPQWCLLSWQCKLDHPCCVCVCVCVKLLFQPSTPQRIDPPAYENNATIPFCYYPPLADLSFVHSITFPSSTPPIMHKFTTTGPSFRASMFYVMTCMCCVGCEKQHVGLVFLHAFVGCVGGWVAGNRVFMLPPDTANHAGF